MITRDDLMAICPRPKSGVRQQVWDGYAAAILSREGRLLFMRYDCYTPARMAMFFGAVVAPETGMAILQESGGYTPERLVAVFGPGRHSAAIGIEEARRLCAKTGEVSIGHGRTAPAKDYAIFERIYGLGNPRKAKELGNTEPGDGYLTRGLGLNQATGREALQGFAAEIGCSIEDLATPINCVHMALIEWDEKNCNTWADQGGETGVINVRKLVNAGSLKVSTSRVNGIPEALRAYKVARRVITADDFYDRENDSVSFGLPEPADVDAPPPASLAHSTEAQVGAGVSTGGVTLVGSATKTAVMTVAKTGTLTAGAIMLELLSNEQFWIGAGLVFAGAYGIFKRKWRFETGRQ